MLPDPLPSATEAELLAATGYPYLPVRVRHRPPLAWNPPREGQEVARYAYTGADGQPRFECIRFHHPAGDGAAPEKAFLWRRMGSDGEWRWGLDDVDTVPYRLPRILAAAAAGERVFVVEGEKDVEALESLGLVATCNPLGAMQWTERHAEALRGAEAVVVPDQDRAGMVHAARVMATLRGRARSAALLLLPGLGRGEDVSDWLARGGDAAALGRLADAAPRDPSPDELARLLDLPPGIDPLSTSGEAVRALLAGARAGGGAAAHPAFRRTVAAFARLGVAVRPSAPVQDAGVPEAHRTYRAVTAAVHGAEGDAAAMLADASLLDRAAYEMGLFSGLLRAATAGEPPPSAGEPDADSADAAFVTAPSARLVRTRWDWDAFVGDPALAEPPESGAAWVFHLPPAGQLQTRRLHPLPAMVLEICARPQTRARAAAAVAERVEGDPERIAALVDAQVAELRASGLLRPAPAERAEATVAEMRALLLADAAPLSPARGLAGLLARGTHAAREAADDALEAAGDPYPLHLLDVSVDMLEQLLAGARVHAAFAAELEGFWRDGDVRSRVRSLTPVLDALARALGSREQAMVPFVIAE